MQLFNDIASGIVGVLLLAFSGLGGTATVTIAPDGSATTTIATSATTTATTSIEADHGLFTGIINALTRLQVRLEKQDRSHGPDDEEDDDDSDERGSSEDVRQDDDAKAGVRDDEVRRDDEAREEKGDDRDDDMDDDDDDRRGSTSGSSGSGSGSSGSGLSVSWIISTNASFTLADVAKHNSTASCWSAINGSVYDLTAWIPLHPGGALAIKGLCGIDGSTAFNDQHGGGKKQAEVLAKYKIGALAQ